MTPEQLTPAKYLEGKILPNYWIVQEPITKHPNGSGGNFSYSYNVLNQNTGQQAFLKALDFSKALSAADPLKAMSILTNLVNYEQNLLEICRSKRLSRIVSLIDSGNYPASNGGIIPVPYFIMELASGDIYNQLDFSQKIDHLLNLQILHSISAALFQLHYNGIAHQDLKPSNILIIEKSPHKLGDLGRADLRSQPPPYAIMDFAGDPSYAPPEALYKSVHQDWIFRRIASDAYQLGSMIVFLYTQLNMTAVMKNHISPKHDWNNWTQTYREVLPYLYVALEKSVDFFKDQVDDKELAKDLSDIIFQLCDPDPTKRGHPKSINKRLSTISLERYITIFDRLLKNYRVKNFRTKI
jgi:eukaryotic-like serine/threonine-protein kinase